VRELFLKTYYYEPEQRLAFTVEGISWEGRLMRRMFLFLCVFLFTAFSLNAEVTVFNVNYESEVLGQNVSIQVCLPDGYDEEDATTYRTIYFLHGGNTYPSYYLSVSDTLDALLSEGVDPMIIVLPYGYPLTWFANSEVTGMYEDHVMNEVIPYIESNYKARANGDSRALMGHSMGGTAAARIGLTHPDDFCAVASHGGELSLRRMLEIMGPRVFTETFGAAISPARGTWCNYTIDCSQTYSPNLEKTYDCDLVLSGSGDIKEDVWSRWKAFDPMSIVGEAESAFGVALYMDIGNVDMWRTTTEVMDDSLTALGIDHTFRLYDGNHLQVAEQYRYSLKFIDDAFKVLSVGEDIQTSGSLPEEWCLVRSYPNPFNSSCTVELELKDARPLTARVYDLLGRELITLHTGGMGAGMHRFNVDLSGHSSGVYLLDVQGGGQQAQHRIVLVR